MLSQNVIHVGGFVLLYHHSRIVVTCDAVVLQHISRTIIVKKEGAGRNGFWY